LVKDILDLSRIEGRLMTLEERDVVLSDVAAAARDAAIAGKRDIISDTGMGMEPERIRQALEPFKQLDGSLARRFEGAGLGLPLANALVRLHGGLLVIDTKPGMGTTVTHGLSAGTNGRTDSRRKRLRAPRAGVVCATSDA
jgi:signal transduction histidine kinase